MKHFYHSSKILFACMLVLLLFSACQNQAPNAANEKTPEKVATESPAQETALSPVVLQKSSINEIRQNQPLTTYIQKKMGEQLWHFSMVRIIKQPAKSKAFEGKWITIIENEEGERPNVSQWKVQFSSNTDDLQIWVGTSRFQNNNTQMKMVRRAEKPKKG